jgi:peptidoglycan/LPS O-acetylase OafA/YrhL
MLDLFADKRLSLEQSRYFDMWRGASAIAVLIGHTIPLYFAGNRLFPAFAGAAVMAFFGLSGFFIHKSLAKGTRDGAFAWRHYAIARINRIMPTFLLALFVTWACWAIAPYVFQSGTRAYVTPTVREAISLDGFARTAFFLNGLLGPTVSANGPLWSLAYEVWFYFGAALVFLGLTGQRMAWAGLALFPIFVIADPWFAVWAACWLAGAAVSMLHASGRLSLVTARMEGVAALLPLGALAGVLLCPEGIVFWVTRLFQVLFSVWFTIHMVRTLSADRLPFSRTIAGTAGFSYTLYVVHFPMLLVAYGISEARWTAPVAALAILAFAAVAGRRIEGFKPLAPPAHRAAAVQSVESAKPEAGPAE